MRFCGNSKPEFTSAERTRSRASRTALSARPTIVNAGRPWRTSASTSTRRASTPSSAKAVTRARLTPTTKGPAAARRSGGGRSKRRFLVIQPDQLPAGVDRHPDRVEAQLRAVRPVADVGQPGSRHPPHLGPLGFVELVPRRAGPQAPRLDLAEHQHPPVAQHEIELAEPRAVVAGQHLVAEPLEVLRRERLAAAAEVLALTGSHGRDARGARRTDQ